MPVQEHHEHHKLERTSYVQKIYVCNPAICSCNNGKCLGSIIDDSVVISDKIRDTHNKNCSNKKQSNQVLYFTYLYINYYIIIDSCWHLLLLHEILSEKKTSDATSNHK